MGEASMGNDASVRPGREVGFSHVGKGLRGGNVHLTEQFQGWAELGT